MITMTLADYADDDKDEDKNGKHGDGKDVFADNASLMLIIIIVYVIYFIDPCLFAQLPSWVFSRVAMRRPPPTVNSYFKQHSRALQRGRRMLRGTTEQKRITTGTQIL